MNSIKQRVLADARLKLGVETADAAFAAGGIRGLESALAIAKAASLKPNTINNAEPIAAFGLKSQF